MGGQMTTLNLTGQGLDRDDIQPKIVKLRNLMIQRKSMWDKASCAHKKVWIKSNKDPIMTLAWDVYKWLDNNFFKDSDYVD